MAHAGPSWEKSPPDLVDHFGALLSEFPEAERRKMFGYPAAFVHGNMFTGLHGSNWIVRLPDDAREELLTREGASVFSPMPGRPMAEYVVVPTALLADDAALRPWITRALRYALTLPPKR